MTTERDAAADALDDVQERVDAIRRRVHDDPGFDVVDPDDVPPIFRDDEGETVDTDLGADQAP